MKKIPTLAILGFLALNSNLSAMEKKEEVKEQNTQAKFTKLDWAKLGAASFGCIWLSSVAALTFPFLTDIFPKNLQFILSPLLPAYLLINPVVQKININRTVTEKENISFALSGIISGVLACGLGAYAYKKLTQLKKSKNSKAK